MEAAIGLGLGDGVVDLVETGTTMRAAGLEVVSEIMKTETVLICNKHSRDKRLVKRIHQRIKGYITATQNVMLSYNIKREALEEAVKITPGHESATVQALQEEDWVAVSALGALCFLCTTRLHGCAVSPVSAQLTRLPDSLHCRSSSFHLASS